MGWSWDFKVQKNTVYLCIYDTSQKWLTEKSAKFWHWTAKDLKFTKVTTGKGTWKKSVEHLSQGNDYITYNCQSLSIPNAWLKLQKQLSPGRPGKKGDPFQKMPSRLQADLSHCYAQMKWFDDEQIPSKGTSIISPIQFAGTDGSEWVSRNTSRDRWDMFSRSLKGSQLQDVCGSGGLTQWNAAMSLKNPRQAFSAGFAAMAGLELGGVPAGGMKFNML